MNPLLLGLAVLFFILFIRLYSRDSNRKLLPPGPTGVPILGNLPQVVGVSQLWHLFDKWKYEYGSLTFLNLAGKDVMVLNSKAAATELLERRSAIYSDRPRSIVANHIGAQMAIPFAGYGKSWQNMRRAAHEVLNARVSTQYQPVQIEEAIILAHGLLYDESSTLLEKINGSASTVISVVYGKRSLSSEKKEEVLDPDEDLHLPESDPLQSLCNIGHRFTSSLYPGAYLVEVLPILDYVPAKLVRWKRNATQDFHRISETFHKFYEDAVQNDQQRNSLCATLADTKLANGLTHAEKAWVTGSISVAALETTSTTLSFFIYAMIQHPHVQQQAQMELDRVVGRTRSPNFTDMAYLPYMRAIVKEVLRWQPAIPLVVPRMAMEDDWYEGHFIPKGTALILNLWSMNRDRDVYGPDVDQFRPERFLQESEKGSDSSYMIRPEYENEDGHCSFGFGRRGCVGKYVADNALFIDMATILWALRIEPAPSKPKIPTKRGPTKDLVNPIPDFECNFLPRFAEAETILQSLQDDVMQGRSSEV
ncbi:cytochrome P450 [Lentinula raphanica]|uniref:Cytochrome P450 n=1 Tax=Lentinula raphanica TaxID=153919 RepID=A0AA38P829_9AGAR|nr:cytochrome P450 [Lentinula raphanica]KAJ3976551.1 cytochrome P450 [Lentinula raphanica]